MPQNGYPPRPSDIATVSSPGQAPGILATGTCVPENVLSNAELASSLGVAANWIEERTGILERRVAAPGDATSDLATGAARQALEAAGVDSADVGVIVLATSTPDMPLPATACQVQANLGAVNAYAMDLDAVCTGFVYALHVAHSLMLCDRTLGYAVVIGADTYSRILDYTDRRTAVLFGDGAGAVVLGRSADAAPITYSRMGSDGRQYDYVRVPAGGSRVPAAVGTVVGGDHYFKMEGRLVRDFASHKLPEIVGDVLDKCGLAVSEIDLLVPHQANPRLLRDLTKEMGFTPEQVAVCGDRYGNTGAASVPIALDEAVRGRRLRDGAQVLLAAFGGGMTWGTALVTWPGRVDPAARPARERVTA